MGRIFKVVIVLLKQFVTWLEMSMQSDSLRWGWHELCSSNSTWSGNHSVAIWTDGCQVLSVTVPIRCLSGNWCDAFPFFQSKSLRPKNRYLMLPDQSSSMHHDIGWFLMTDQILGQNTSLCYRNQEKHKSMIITCSGNRWPLRQSLMIRVGRALQNRQNQNNSS